MPQDEGITSELQDIIEAAASPFLTEGSDEGDETPEAEEPEAEDEEVEEVDDTEESDEEDSEEDEDEASDEDEDPETVEDEDDQDNLEDDEEDESEDDEEDEEDEEPEPDLHTVKVNGEEFQVSTDELKSGYQRHSDYTQKLQRVHDVYRKMESWYEERANNPTGWIAEIAYGQEDPAEAIAGAIKETGNATVLLGQTLRHLVESGEIADELVEHLNLREVAAQYKEQSVHQKVQSLEDQIKQRDAFQAEQAQMAQVEAELTRQWQAVVTDNALEFSSPDEEYGAKVQLLTFASNHGIPNLEVAWAAMTTLDGKQQAAPPKKQQAKQTPKKRKQAETAVKKRKTAAMSRKPTGSGGKTRASARGDIVYSAAEEAMKELGL